MKTKFKIAFVTLILGWFLIVIAFLVYAGNVNTGKTLAFIAVTICMFGAMYFNTMLNNKQFWLSQEELEDAISRYNKGIVLYEKAANELALFVIEHSKIGKKGEDVSTKA